MLHLDYQNNKYFPGMVGGVFQKLVIHNLKTEFNK